MIIKKDDMTDPAVVSMLKEHFEELSAIVQVSGKAGYVLPFSALQEPNVTMYTAWSDFHPEELMDCAALKKPNPKYGEVKSMCTVTKHLRKRVAVALLDHVKTEAKQRGYERLVLQTGKREEFAAGRALYRRNGLVECEPYEGYEDASGQSVFMMFELQ